MDDLRPLSPIIQIGSSDATIKEIGDVRDLSVGAFVISAFFIDEIARERAWIRFGSEKLFRRVNLLSGKFSIGGVLFSGDAMAIVLTTAGEAGEFEAGGIGIGPLSLKLSC